MPADIVHVVLMSFSSSLPHLDHAEQKITLGTCDRAAKLSQAQIREFKPRADVVANLKDLFGEEVLELKMTSMADSMHALSCHNMTLPCSDKVRELSAVCCCCCCCCCCC